MSLRLFIAALVTLLPAGAAGAEVVHVKDYNLHTPRDRGVLFAMAVTPEQDVLSFVAKGDGKWLLTRVRNWLDKAPLEQTIEVPGWSRADLVGAIPPVYAILFVAPDGRFAICIASGFLNRSGKRSFDDMISVVDLREFKVVTTAHTPANPDEIRSFYLDRAQRFVLMASTSFPRVRGQDPFAGGSDQRLVFLDLPTLAIADQCQFREWMRQGAGERREDESNCEVLLSRVSDRPVSLAGYLDELVDSFGFPRIRQPSSQPCTSHEVTRDRRFELEHCQNFHHNWLDNPVVTDKKVNIRSRGTGVMIDTINQTTRDTVDSKLAYQNDRDFLLIMEGGTKLKVYELKE